MIDSITNTIPTSSIRPGDRVFPVSGDFSVSKSPIRTDSTEQEHETTASDNHLFDPSAYYLSLSGAVGVEQANTPAPSLAFNKAIAEHEEPASEETNLEDNESQGINEEEDTENAKPGDKTNSRGEPLDDQQQREVDELENRDREVRQHEQAHKAVGGQYAGAISYEYQQGPDGKRYAVGGEVSIDVSKENEPAATIAKMRQVRAAAMAPAEPSGQDRSVAAEASKIEAEARRELNSERQTQSSEGSGQGEKAADGEGDGKRDTTDSEPISGGLLPNVPANSRSSNSFPYAKLSAPSTSLDAYSQPTFSGLGSSGFLHKPIDLFA